MPHNFVYKKGFSSEVATAENEVNEEAGAAAKPGT
jgi:hypothetical protein